MPLNVPSYSGDPTSSTAIVNAYASVDRFAFDRGRQAIDITIGYYRSKADRDSGHAAINSAPYHFTPNVETRADGATLPSFAQVIGLAATLSTDAAGTLAFALIDRAVVEFLMTLPEFAGSTEVA